MRFLSPRALALAAFTVALAGCDALDPADRVALLTDEERYTHGRSGAAVELRLRNDANDALEYNFCNATLERRDGKRWRPVEGGLRGCRNVTQRLIPDAEARDVYTLDADVVYNAEYRFVLAVRIEDDGTRTLESPSFRVGWPEE